MWNRSFALALVGLLFSCNQSADKVPAVDAPASAASKAGAGPDKQPAAPAPKTPTAKKTAPEGEVSLPLSELRFLEKGKLVWTTDSTGAMKTPAGKVVGTFSKDGVLTNTKGEFRMALKPGGTVLRPNQTPFRGKLTQDGRYVPKMGEWSIDDAGNFLMMGRPVGGMKIEGVTAKNRVFAMLVMVALLHPLSESVIGDWD